MKFKDMIVPKEPERFPRKEYKETKLFEADKLPEDILRKAGIKIKLITGTSFGKQIDLFKKISKEELEKILKDFTIKINNKSLFIVY